MNVLEQNTLIRLCITSKETAFYFWLQFWSQTTNCIVMNALMKSSQVFLSNEQYFLPIKKIACKNWEKVKRKALNLLNFHRTLVVHLFWILHQFTSFMWVIYFRMVWYNIFSLEIEEEFSTLIVDPITSTITVQ